MADVLSQITTHLGQEAMQSILDGVTLRPPKGQKEMSLPW